jgi:hypothetical protein
MPNAILYVPIITTVFSLIFSVVLLRRYREKGRGPHLLWWAFGVFIYAVGTFTESFTSVFGWNEAVFRAWYISGALLGGAPLAQGTVYLLLRRKTANRLTAALVADVIRTGHSGRPAAERHRVRLRPARRVPVGAARRPGLPAARQDGPAHRPHAASEPTGTGHHRLPRPLWPARRHRVRLGAVSRLRGSALRQVGAPSGAMPL